LRGSATKSIATTVDDSYTKGSEDYFEMDVGFGGFTDYTFTKSSGFTQAYTLYTINYLATSAVGDSGVCRRGWRPFGVPAGHDFGG
jgi:hypothetical protein